MSRQSRVSGPYPAVSWAWNPGPWASFWGVVRLLQQVESPDFSVSLSSAALLDLWPWPFCLGDVDSALGEMGQEKRKLPHRAETE